MERLRALLAVGLAVTLPVAAQFGPASTALAWGTHGSVVDSISTSGTVSDVTVTGDGSGGVYAAWSDNRSGNYDVYVTRLNSSGALATGWTSNGNNLSPLSGDQRHPRLTVDNTGGVYVAWEDPRSGYSNVYLQRVTSAGAVASGWPSTGSAVGARGRAQVNIALAAEGTSHVLLTWLDCVAAAPGNTSKIVAQRASAASGSVGTWPNDSVGVTVAEVSTNNTSEPHIALDGAGGCYVAWDIFIQRLGSSNGASQWSSSPYYGLVIDSDAFTQPHVVSDGAGGVFASCGTHSGSNYGIVGNHYTSDGTADAGALLASGTTELRAPLMVADGWGGVVVAWIKYSGGTADLYAARMRVDGSLPCNSSSGVLVSSNTGATTGARYAMAPDLRGGCVLVWANGSNDIVARRFKPDGSVESAQTLCSASGSQTQPSACLAEYGSVIAAWRDARSGYDNAAFANQFSFSSSAEAGLGTLAVGTVGSTGLNLDWLVPANQSPYGSATHFDIRYATSAINEGTFDAAAQAAIVEAAGGSGTEMCYPVAGLERCTTYYFAMRTLYSCGGWSLISNGASATTGCVGYSATDCEWGALYPGGEDLKQYASEPALRVGQPSHAPDLTYEIPPAFEGAAFDLSVFDVAGRRVKQLQRGAAVGGLAQTVWDARDEKGSVARAGVYFVQLRIRDVRVTRAIIVTR